MKTNTTKTILACVLLLLIIPVLSLAKFKDIVSETSYMIEYSIVESGFDDQIQQELDKLNGDTQLLFDVSPMSRNKYNSKVVARKEGTSQYGYAGGQPRNGFYFEKHNGYIYWRDSSYPSINVGVSIDGQYISFNLGLGTASASGVSGVSQYVPANGWYKLRVARTYEVRKVNIYKHVGNKVTLHDSMVFHELTGYKYQLEKQK